MSDLEVFRAAITHQCQKCGVHIYSHGDGFRAAHSNWDLVVKVGGGRHVYCLDCVPEEYALAARLLANMVEAPLPSGFSFNWTAPPMTNCVITSSGTNGFVLGNP